jgi:hypothetical protein
LKEYGDLFPKGFIEMKGIDGSLGEMKIQMKFDTKPMRKIPYRMNPKYKETEKQEPSRMLEMGLIFHVKQFDYIIPMVIQNKKIGGIRICTYFHALNQACVHDPFPTPFTNEILENVVGPEIYSFTYGFLDTIKYG